MERELQRLSSFSMASWPHTGTSVTPERLAAAGFFASPTLETPDRAVCFSCKNAVVNWDPTDDPWIEHKRWYPACDFVLGKATDNVPIRIPTSSLMFPSVKDRLIQDTLQTDSDSLYVLGLLAQLKINGTCPYT